MSLPTKCLFEVKVLASNLQEEMERCQGSLGGRRSFLLLVGAVVLLVVFVEGTGKNNGLQQSKKWFPKTFLNTSAIQFDSFMDMFFWMLGDSEQFGGRWRGRKGNNLGVT